jgi:hypothetical protein
VDPKFGRLCEILGDEADLEDELMCSVLKRPLYDAVSLQLENDEVQSLSEEAAQKHFIGEGKTRCPQTNVETERVSIDSKSRQFVQRQLVKKSNEVCDRCWKAIINWKPVDDVELQDEVRWKEWVSACEKYIGLKEVEGGLPLEDGFVSFFNEQNISESKHNTLLHNACEGGMVFAVDFLLKHVPHLGFVKNGEGLLPIEATRSLAVAESCLKFLEERLSRDVEMLVQIPIKSDLVTLPNETRTSISQCLCGLWPTLYKDDKIEQVQIIFEVFCVCSLSVFFLTVCFQNTT